jgi:hypothetical protein
MLAVWGGDLDLAELLLATGAKPEYAPPNSKVGSPVALAKKRKVDGFFDLLRTVRKSGHGG